MSGRIRGPFSRFIWAAAAWLFRFEALAWFLSLLASALHNVSRAFDVWYYHMPFATRLVGLVTPETFLFHSANEERFKGFPLLAEWVQGTLWLVTDHPPAANLFAFSSVPLLAWFLRRRFSVPLYASLLCFIGIPLVHIHATNCHIDLPASAATTVVALLAIHSYVSPEPPTWRTMVLGGIATGIAINTKQVVHPMTLACFVALSLRAITQSRLLPSAARSRYRRYLALGALTLPILFYNPLRNAIVFKNPYYPHQLVLMGHQFPGAEEEYSSSPYWLQDYPRPVRFAASILEMGARPYSDTRRWTVDQWVPRPDPAYRMGGFFGWYVVANLAVLLLRLVRHRSRAVVVATSGFGIMTALTSILPQSHELRYNLYWMLTLVSVNLWLACRPGAFLSVLFGPRTFALIATAAIAVVVHTTRGDYSFPTNLTFAELVKKRVNQRTRAQIREGETVCVMREPWNLLWAAPFHGDKHYVIQSAQTLEQCNGHRVLRDPPRRSPRRR